jgi:hypothetical protein
MGRYLTLPGFDTVGPAVEDVSAQVAGHVHGLDDVPAKAVGHVPIHCT